MIDRYSRPDMVNIWSDQTKFKIWYEIEAYACEAQAKLGIIPQSAVDAIWSLKDHIFDSEKINSIEKTTKHDVIAFLTYIAEFIGTESRFIHQGMTSSDILDTCLNIQLDNPRFAREKGIETIYQDLALADNLNVGANIFLGREPITKKFGIPVIDRELMLSESKKILKNLEINIPESSLDEPVGKLSGGQRQAVAIGRALYWNAKLLIMDEPTAALGVPEQRNVMELIKKLKEKKVSIIFISHNLTDIFQASDRIVVLRRGVIAGERFIEETNSDEVVKLMVQG